MMFPAISNLQKWGRLQAGFGLLIQGFVEQKQWIVEMPEDYNNDFQLGTEKVKIIYVRIYSYTQYRKYGKYAAGSVLV